MKMIIELNQSTIENMQGYCEVQNITPNELIEDLFNKHVQGPAEVIDKLSENNELNKLREFSILLTRYLNDAIYDIEESAKSSEAYETDTPMIEVFKVLNRDLVDDAHILTTLYKAYKGANENEHK